MPPYLDQNLISELYGTSVELGLQVNRAALFQHIPPGYWGLFPAGGGPNAQLFIDLGQLNTTSPLLDGSIPLRQWLRNAWDLTNSMAKGEVFARAAATLDRKLASSLGS